MIALPGGIWAYRAWGVVLVTRNEGVRGKGWMNVNGGGRRRG